MYKKKQFLNMRNLFGVFVLVLLCSQNLVAQSSDSTSFKYGIIGRTRAATDSIFKVTDNYVLHSWDLIKIYYQIESGSACSIVFKNPLGEYNLIKPDSKSDSLLVRSSLNWLMLDSKTGTETICFISSKERLSDFEDLFTQYGVAKNKEKLKIRRKISAELIKLTTAERPKPQMLASRHDKPENLGATFKSIYKKGIEEYLFNECKGRSVAFDIVKIIHK